MKKTALVLGLFVFALNSYDKYDPSTFKKKFNSNLTSVKFISSEVSQKEKMLVQLPHAGMSQIKFGKLQETIGRINVANHAVDDNTQIYIVETLNHNVTVKRFNKMIDDFNLLYATDNEVLMQNYQNYSNQNCKKIYGCVGTLNDEDYDWKIIKFLPSPEKCTFEPTITMSNVMLFK